METKHENLLLLLCQHERREVRKIAQRGLFQIRPSDAERYADGTRDWLECGRSWIAHHNNNEEAGRCLQEAFKLFEYSQQLKNCLDFCFDELKDQDETKKYLIRAEKQSCAFGRPA